MPLKLTALYKVVLTSAAFVACAPSLAAESEHPDFTGIWTLHREPGQRRFSGFGQRTDLPFTAEGKRRVDEYRKLLGPENANPAAYCVDYGMPTVMEQPGGYPFEFIQKPDQLTIIYEVESEMRRIYMGDKHIPPEKRIPSRDGYSEGHWEGNTLVVVTTDLMDGQDQLNNPHSDQAKIVERFSPGKTDDGTKLIDYEMTLTDPIYYTAPVKVERKWQPLKNGYIIPYRCPDEFWYALLELRRAQLKAGKPADAPMSEVYKAREAKE